MRIVKFIINSFLLVICLGLLGTVLMEVAHGATEISNTAHLVIFREPDQSALKNSWKLLGTLGNAKTDIAGNSKWTIYIDGHKVVKMGQKQYVILAIEPGAHMIKTERSDSLQLTFSPQETIFVRPRPHDAWNQLHRGEELNQLPCEDAVKADGMEEINSSKLFYGKIEESSYPRICH